MAKLDERGHEILDPTPVAIPAGFRHPPSLEERILRSIRSEMSRQAALNGQETFEEADDFECGDDYDPSSPYEEHFDHERNINALKSTVEENRKRKRGSNGSFVEETPVVDGASASNNRKEVKNGKEKD